MKFCAFGGQLLTFHIDASGHVVQNTYNFGGGRPLTDHVLYTGAVGSPDVWYDGTYLHLAFGCSGGSGGYMFYSSGHWHDSLGNILSGI